MGSVTPTGGSSNVPQEPPQEPSTTNQDQLQSIQSFSTMIQDLASLMAEAKEGGKSHG